MSGILSSLKNGLFLAYRTLCEDAETARAILSDEAVTPEPSKYTYPCGHECNPTREISPSSLTGRAWVQSSQRKCPRNERTSQASVVILPHETYASIVELVRLMQYISQTNQCRTEAELGLDAQQQRLDWLGQEILDLDQKIRASWLPQQDAMLRSLGKRADLIALARLHVPEQAVKLGEGWNRITAFLHTTLDQVATSLDLKAGLPDALDLHEEDFRPTSNSLTTEQIKTVAAELIDMRQALSRWSLGEDGMGKEEQKRQVHQLCEKIKAVAGDIQKVEHSILVRKSTETEDHSQDELKDLHKHREALIRKVDNLTEELAFCGIEYTADGDFVVPTVCSGDKRPCQDQFVDSGGRQASAGEAQETNEVGVEKDSSRP